MWPHRQAVWGNIWKRTVEKSQTNATNVTMHPLRQAIWEHILKHTMVQSRTNATSVTMHPLMQAIWEHIWKHTVEKNQTNVTSVTLHLFMQALWGLTWKYTVATPHMLSHFRRLAWIRKPFRHNFTNIMSANIDPPPYIHHIFVVSWTGIHSSNTFL